ncbi:MAG TPA: thiamine pyrophosphate-dependent enzyme [Prolixibacteraceae bacterium]|nr:thiamine pyrophosphate-dependent enzyme [Prolixibacteraceae bacterium]
MYLEDTEISSLLTLKTDELLHDYFLASLSRQLTLLGRKEVHSGRAHFGIFGDGKEIAQLALAKTFRKGDWRSGYYRDQTFMLALGLLQPEEFFAMIYGETDPELNPSTGGRNFNNHFTSPNIGADGVLLPLNELYNMASDISPTAGQMPRLLGLAQASKLLRDAPEDFLSLRKIHTGNEVAFGTIGDAATSGGLFFETVNAACVLQVPVAITVFDDGYGISVPVEQQTAKASISKALEGFRQNGMDRGMLIYRCRGWDYPALLATFRKGIDACRIRHVPVLFHIDELTQPTGHSTSGSHERYKSPERLEWEKRMDGLVKFREYLLYKGIASDATLVSIEKRAKERARQARDKAWDRFRLALSSEAQSLKNILDELLQKHPGQEHWRNEWVALQQRVFPTRRSLLRLAKHIHYDVQSHSGNDSETVALKHWIDAYSERARGFYNRQLYREGSDSALAVQGLAPEYNEGAGEANGSEILNRNFDALFSRFSNLITFGEDTGKLGDVNQGMKGLQKKYGATRVFDTGIREATIIGQGIGLALRGFRPIAEIQYLDYLIEALPTLSDDLATLQYRTLGKQAAPLIIRTRGHQLQGIWHAGSPMSMLLGSLRGIYLCVPRDMTRAAGFYNTLLESNDPALVIEPLKGYNCKEPIPANPGRFRIPLGIPEIVTPGDDLTLVTYGWNVHHAQKAALFVQKYGVSIEVIDVQTLLPFDRLHSLRQSVKKTNRILFVDEDVSGGATAFMLQKTIDEQKIFDFLETAPRTLSATDHRPAYGIDGEYFSKPNVEEIVESVMEMMHEVNPKRFPKFS